MESFINTKPLTYDETLYDHLRERIRVNFLFEETDDHINSFLSTKIEDQPSPDYVEFTYGNLEEKNVLVEYLLTKLLTRYKIDNELKYIADLTLIDNNGNFNKYQFFHRFIQFLKSENMHVGMDTLAILENKMTTINNYTINEYCLSLMKLKAHLASDQPCKFLIIDSSNNFDLSDRKIKTKKESTLGRRSSIIRRVKDYNLGSSTVDALNKLECEYNVNIIDFKIDHFYKENAIFIDKQHIFVSKKLQALIRYKTEKSKILSVYLFNPTYAKFISDLVDLRKLGSHSGKRLFACLKTVSSPDPNYWLILYRIDHGRLHIIHEELLKNENFID